MIIEGAWYSAQVSDRRPAEIRVTTSDTCDEFDLFIDGEYAQSGRVHDLSVSDRLGSIPRSLRWADGSIFETRDNKNVDHWLAACRYQSGAGQWVHRLERSWGWAVASLALIVGLAAFTYLWGLPVAANRIADSLPVPVHEAISDGALATMDRIFFKPTSLDEETQAEISSRFDNLLALVTETDFKLRLHFRNIEIGGEQIPNALALPGGDIIVTDGLLPLIDDPRELDSILLHEIGHVIERHGMQHVIQASAISVIASLAIGNVGGVAELTTGVPIFLMQSRYSRRSETDADTFAFERMIDAGIDPIHFANAIKNITGEYEESGAEGTGYFSTHPATQERARRASEYSNQYRSR